MQSSETKIVRISDIGMYFDLLHLSDAKLRTDDGCTFEIHRAILAVNSDYFRAMFCGMDRDRREFMIPGMSGECLNNILFYVYTGNIRVTERNVKDLMTAADYLLLKDLHMKIKQSIKANMTELNCLGILKVAHQIRDEDTFKECYRFVQTRFERCQKDELAYFPLDLFRSILSNRSLYVYNETTVWKAIVEWAQKDIQFRMCCVPPLLLTLAMEDVGEELATAILQHEIISENSLMKYIRSPNDLTSSNLDTFLLLLSSYSNPFTQPYSHRIPRNLHVISSYNEAENSSALYITYDENVDLWRKITEVSFYTDFLIAIRHNIYIFDMLERICLNFDLSSMDWVTMEHFRNEYYADNYCVLATDAYIYILGKITEEQNYVVEVYDTANNRWFDGVSIPNICYGASVAIDKKIYLVGYTRSFDGMTTRMFDPVTQHWSILSRPTVDRICFALVAYHQKMYLVGGSNREKDFYFSNAEVFDPATNLWKELPNLPYTYSCTEAEVFNDQIVVYDGNFENERNMTSVCWNDATECWEKFDKTYTLENLRFCSIDDVDTIRMITKQNRDPITQMENSMFV